MNPQQPSLSSNNAAPLIFVVDDSPDVGEMLEVFFRHAGFPARIFTDPLRALTAMEAASPKPRVLVSDFRMPHMNGLELMHRCKLLNPGLKIISASAHLMEEEIEKYPIQPDHILPKPYTTTELLAWVKVFLQESRPESAP